MLPIQIIGFFVLISEDGYWAKSESPSCLICFFFRLKTHKWCCLFFFLFSFFLLQHFRTRKFEEGRAFWQILWRSTERMIRNYLLGKQNPGRWACITSSFLFIKPAAFWLYHFLLTASDSFPTQFQSPEFCLNLLQAFLAILPLLALIFSIC